MAKRIRHRTLFRRIACVKEDKMKKVIAASLLCFSVMGFFGCATNTGTGAATGAGIGALAGQLIGRNTTSTLIGAGIGALLGGLVGNYLDHQNKTREQSITDTGYYPSQGYVLHIDAVDSAPLTVRPGDVVRLKVTFDVIAPDPNTTVNVTETRVITCGGQPVSNPIERVSAKQQGNRSSTYQFKIPSDATPGEYEVLTTIDNGVMRDTGLSKFYIQPT
jgi:hypothetical protein